MDVRECIIFQMISICHFILNITNHNPSHLQPGLRHQFYLKQWIQKIWQLFCVFLAVSCGLVFLVLISRHFPFSPANMQSNHFLNYNRFSAVSSKTLAVCCLLQKHIHHINTRLMTTINSSHLTRPLNQTCQIVLNTKLIIYDWINLWLFFIIDQSFCWGWNSPCNTFIIIIIIIIIVIIIVRNVISLYFDPEHGGEAAHEHQLGPGGLDLLSLHLEHLQDLQHSGTGSSFLNVRG